MRRIVLAGSTLFDIQSYNFKTSFQSIVYQKKKKKEKKKKEKKKRKKKKKQTTKFNVAWNLVTKELGNNGFSKIPE